MAITAAGVAAAGNFLSGAGSLLGAFSGGNKTDNVGNAKFAQTMQLDTNQREFDQKMFMAKQHGLHPLTVLGIPSSNLSYPIQTGSDSGPDVSSIGYGVNQIGKALVKPPEADPLELRAAEANVRLLEAQAKRAEWDALGTEFQVADYAAPALLRGQPGNPPGVRRSNDVVAMEDLVARQSGIPSSYLAGRGGPVDISQTVLPPHPKHVGVAAGTDQGWVNVQDKTGKQTRVLNKDAIQADFEMGATITTLAKRFGIERAIEISAVLENAGVIGAIGAGVGLAGRALYKGLNAWWNKPVKDIPAYRHIQRPGKRPRVRGRSPD